MIYLRRYDLNWNFLFKIDGDTPLRRKSVHTMFTETARKQNCVYGSEGHV